MENDLAWRVGGVPNAVRSLRDPARGIAGVGRRVSEKGKHVAVRIDDLEAVRAMRGSEPGWYCARAVIVGRSTVSRPAFGATDRLMAIGQAISTDRLRSAGGL